MSMDNRSTSALFKRAEQLKRWDESEANKHSGTPKSPSMRRIKFSSGCIFLAACVAGDKDEVSRLLETGADIDTANVDGLTALHQACIDDNLDMVEFLVQNGADVNRKDNEGWTPLHATSSCGFLSIARYLIESGADLASINSDGELALDLACSDAMEDLIQRHIDEQGIDCEDARQAEEKIMLSDAKRWLRTDSTDCDKPHPKTGATALHVAAAKGYTKVLSLLLDGRGDFDKQDVDGWTALHAAAYWGQKEAVQILLNANVDIDIQNYSGQYAIDIAQKDIVPLLDEARKNFKRPKRRPASQIRITDTIENSIETPTKVIRVEVKPIDSKEKEELAIGSDSEEEQEEEALEEDENGIEDEGSGSDRDESIEQEEAEEEEEEEAEESEEDQEEPEAEEEATVEPEQEEAEEEEESEVEAESSPYSSSADSSSSTESSMTESDAEVPEKENQPTEPDVILRRTQSFESDEKFYQKYVELRARIQANSCPILPNTNPTANAKTATNNSSNSYLVQRSASLKDHRTLRKASSNLVLGSTGSTTGSATTNVQTATTSPPTSPTGTPVTTPSTGQIRSITPVNNNNNISHTSNSPSIPVEVTVTSNNNNNNDNNNDTSSNAVNKNHSLFELNRKYIEQAQKTKINNERNKFLSSLNEKRLQQQHPQETQQPEAKAPSETAQPAASQSGSAEKEPSPAEAPATVKSVTAVYASSASNNNHAASNINHHNHNNNNITNSNATSQQPSPTVTSTNKLSPGNIFKNFFKSFVPPTRDEESETQRKAHAKRVRETRRSTQGVTLDEIKSAEQLVKKKNSTNSDFKLEDATAPTSTPATNAASSTVTALDSSNSRQQQQQQNELNSISMSSLAQRRQNGDSSNLFTSSRPTSAPELSSSAAAVAAAAAAAAVSSQNDASLHLRNRPLKASGEENKENDKENENRSNAQATQAVIQRRRRPKRRSTGVVHVDMEDIDPERQDSPVDGEEKESGTERGRSRVGSTASELADQQKDAGESKENGGDYIDYKALYEQAKADNNKLKSEMRKKDEEVASLQAALERFTVATTKNNSLSELEKRERRAMERKMSEMEEELKLLQKYKTENERLRAENRALTRVVSKLTTSAQNQLHSKQ
ncbi:protein phosphatase 1 regulatory subunit 12A isoform X9 [Ochlerotatus camptorhynchus]|uniref:protein phosphatase 1 regulatory subunit 12A isoform X9 n=1 Tax=Ochlerotatus camptorhynchus TaxID=644619 RepID=UPI0031DA4685